MSATTPSRAEPRRASRPWFSGLFWKYALGVLAISYAGTMLLILIELAAHGRRLGVAFENGAVAVALRERSADLAPQFDRVAHDEALCRTLLETTLRRLVAPGGELYNPYGTAVVAPRSGGWALAYRNADGACRYPADPPATLAAALDADERGRPTPGDVALASIDVPSGARLTLALQRANLFDAISFVHRRESTSLLGYLAIISVICALALAALLVRRIRRAERAADAWAEGELTARIDERARDEFGRLAQRFDRMADALGEHISVKQALAAADERNRLARDLHDTAKQRCFALGLQLSVLRHRAPQDPALLGMVDGVVSLASRLQSDLDDVIRRVGAPAIAEAGLRRTLEYSIDLLLRDSGIAWSLDFDAGDETALARHSSLAAQLLLIVNEAVANALRHSGAQSVAVSIARRDGGCRCSVADDGCGFDPRTARVGMGLANMRARAAALPRGSLEIDSAAGRGTRVTVAFLLAKGNL